MNNPDELPLWFALPAGLTLWVIWGIIKFREHLAKKKEAVK